MTLDWPALWALGMSVGDSLPVKLTVNDGYVDATDTAYLVYDNTAPNACAGPTGEGSTYEIYKGDGLQLSAALSSDSDGGPNAMTYEWDLNEDDVFGDESGVVVNLTWAQLVGHGFGAPMTRTIKVKVSDGDLESIAESSVTVKLPEVSIAFTDGIMGERKIGSDDGVLEITRTGPTTNALSGSVTIPTMVPGVTNLATTFDFTVSSLNWTILAGMSSTTIVFTTANETTAVAANVEGEEILVVNLETSADYTRMTTSAQATISDNDRWDFDYSGNTLAISTTNHIWGDGSEMWSSIGAGKTSARTVEATVSGTFDPSFGFDRQVALELELTFDINESTGVITMSTPTWMSSNTTDGALSCGFGWSVNVDQTNHLATVSFSTLTVYAGGRVEMTAGAPPIYGATVSLVSDYTWSYAETVAGIIVNLQGVVVED